MKKIKEFKPAIDQNIVDPLIKWIIIQKTSIKKCKIAWGK
jgi:hypothetical protein